MLSGSGCCYEMFRECSLEPKKKKEKKLEGAKPDDKLDPARCIAFPQCFQWQGNSKLHETLPYGPLAKSLRATICSAGS